MSGFKSMMKEGWHPKGRDGGSESWRGDFKGINQVAGWMGKGRESQSERAEKHTSQPLSSLRDPASFGPPPRHSAAGATPGTGLAAPLSQQQVQQQNTRLEQQQQAEIEQEEQTQRPVPSVPYRVDTTGLSTSNLPPPPRRLDSPVDSAAASPRPKPTVPPRIPPRTNNSHSDSPPPAYTPIQPSTQSDGSINQDATSRLARSGVSVSSLGIGDDRHSPSTASPTAVNELQSRFSHMRTGSAKGPPPPPPSRAKPPPLQTSGVQDSSAAASPGGLQSAKSTISNFREKHSDKIDAGKQHMSNFRERHSDKIDAGKQHASNFREKHSDKIDAGKQKIGMSTGQSNSADSPGEPRSATSTIGNFREKHGDKIDTGKQHLNTGKQHVSDFREKHSDKIDAGKQKISGVNEKYGISQRVNTFIDDKTGRKPRESPPTPARQTPPLPPPSRQMSSGEGEPAGLKKKPPPPPPKKSGMRASPVDAPASPALASPPPIPMATKPR